MQSLWTPCINPFARAIARSTADASAIGQHTADTLEAEGATNPAIAELSDDFASVNGAYQASYGAKDAKLGQQKMATATIHALEEGLPVQLNSWDLAVQTTGAIKGSPAYLEFFPQGHKPFLSGKRPERIVALTSLSLGMTGKPALAAKKVEVDAVLDAYIADNSTQTTKMEATDAHYDSLDNLGDNLAVGLYDVLGGLMRVYKNDPEQIERFFRLDLIRRKTQTEFTGSVDAGATKFIVKRTLDAAEDIVLQNSGTGPLAFYFAPAKDTPYTSSTPSVQVLPGGSETVIASSMGASTSNVYLLVINLGPDEGHWTVEI